MSEENDSLDLEQHILRRMSNEYLFVWHHFCSLVVLNGQPNQNISCYHKKGKQFLFSQKVPFTWYHCPQTRTGLRNLSRSLTTRSLFEPFPFPFQLLPCLCWVFQIEPLERDPVNIEDESMRCFHSNQDVTKENGSFPDTLSVGPYIFPAHNCSFWLIFLWKKYWLLQSSVLSRVLHWKLLTFLGWHSSKQGFLKLQIECVWDFSKSLKIIR